MTAQPIPAPIENPDSRDSKPKPRHGTMSGYETGCRCDDCQDWFWLWQFGSEYMKLKRRQRAEYRQRPEYRPRSTEPERLRKQPPKLAGCMDPSVYTIELHRALKEQLCERCTQYLNTFS